MKTDQPSATAIFVANGVWWVSIHSKLKTEVPELLGELNLEMVRHVNRGVDNKLGRKILEVKTGLMQTVVMPGFYLHFVLRKRSIEKFVRQAVQQNARQLVVIGAGFDTLSVRMAREFSDLQIPRCPDLWIRSFPDSKIARFPDCQKLATTDELSDPNLTPLPTHPGIKYVARALAAIYHT